MFRNHAALAAGLALFIPAACARAQYAPAPAPSEREQVQAIEFRIRVLMERLNSVNQQVQREEARYKAGAATSDSTEALQAQAREIKLQVARAEQDLAAHQRRAALTREVSVDLHDATADQAAQVLTKASGVQVSVDKSVPSDLRFTVHADAVPLALVLDAIASHGNLEIAPEPNGAVLKSWPTLTVGDHERQVFTGPMAPWSEEWGPIPPTSLRALTPTAVTTPAPSPSSGATGNFSLGAGSGTGVFAPPAPVPFGGGNAGFAPGVGAYGSGIAGPSPAMQEGMMSGMAPGGMPGGGGPGMGMMGGPMMGPGGLGIAPTLPGLTGGPVALTTVGTNLIVVAEPARDRNGRHAILLTVYRLDGGKLRKVSSFLHHGAETAPAQPRGRMPFGGMRGMRMPGMPGMHSNPIPPMPNLRGGAAPASAPTTASPEGTPGEGMLRPRI